MSSVADIIKAAFNGLAFDRVREYKGCGTNNSNS